MRHLEILRRPARRIGWLLGLSALCLAGIGSAQAGSNNCGAHDKLNEILAQRFSEAPVGMGLAASGQVLQVYASGDGDSWTIVATSPKGQSCILATGKHWQVVEPVSNDPSA